MSTKIKIILFVLISISLTNCTSVPPSVTPPPTSVKGIPSAHAWQYFFKHDKEELGYATYSYVLVGRDTYNKKSNERYLELIKAIKSSSVESDIFQENARAKLNLFVIPVVNDNVDAPNYSLAKYLLALLSMNSTKKFSSAGPYIITTREPIVASKENKIINMLYVDLTNVHLKVIPEIVKAYQQEITSKPISGTEQYHSLRLSLINIGLLSEEYIGIANISLEKLQQAFPH